MFCALVEHTQSISYSVLWKRTLQIIMHKQFYEKHLIQEGGRTEANAA